MTLPPRLAVRWMVSLRPRLGVLLGRVGAAAVGALDDQDIGGRQHGGVAQQRDLGPPEVAGIDQPPVLGLEIQGDDGRAQHVPGIVKGQGDARHQLVRLFIADPLEVAQTLDRVLAGVDGLDRGLAISGAMPVDVFHVFLLDMAAVREHIAAQVRRGLGADNLAPETMFHQVGDIARMVDMGVRQDHHIHRPAAKGNSRLRRRASSRLPSYRPQSRRILCSFTVIKCWEPVTVSAAPKKVISILGTSNLVGADLVSALFRRTA